MDLEATPEERIELEYSTQHFGFTPDSFVETITDNTMEILNSNLDETKAQLTKTFSKKVSAQELDECFAVIKNRYVVSTEKILDNFSRYVKKNIFFIPKNTVLPEDRVSAIRSEQKQSQDSSNATDIQIEELYTGDDLIESIKGFERQCKNVKNLKYKEAVLRAKLKNLETVAKRQRTLLRKAEDLNECGKSMDNIINKQMDILDDKLISLKEICNQQPATQDVEKDVNDVESSDKPAEKRKLEIAGNEEAIMAMKCRKFEKADCYSKMDVDKKDSI